jgi:hypothetical protein
MTNRIHVKASRISTAMIISLLFVLLFPGFSGAEEATTETYRGRILKVNGDVEIINARGEARKASESRLVIREMDTIITHKGGKAVVQFTDGALSVLDEKSSLRIEKISWMSHLGGKIYFTFRKVFGGSRKVKSKFATIGIRGTTFIVYGDEEGEGVALQEGELEVESPGEAYEIHKQKVVDEFEAFKQQARGRQAALQDEYADYRKQTMKEFVEYKKSFTLASNRVIRFDDNRVDETEMGEETKAEFDDFEAIAGEMLIDFRQQSKQHREKQGEQD